MAQNTSNTALPQSLPTVMMFAGPNGSGKSTVTKPFLAAHFEGEYINADDIAKTLEAEIPDYTERNMRAADIATERRDTALRNGESFAFETVMSTPEKVALMTQARGLGYQVSLLFVTTNDPEINVQRVALRVEAGGHAVDPVAIRKRYAQTMDLLACAVEHADFASIFDNTGSYVIDVAVKEDDGVLHLTPNAEGIAWVFDKLRQPYYIRQQSRLDCAAIVGDARPIVPAVAEDLKDYHGVILHVTPWHVLQDVAGGLVLHDRQLSATQACTVGQVQTVSYRYKFGKLVDLAVPAPVKTSAPRPR